MAPLGSSGLLLEEHTPVEISKRQQQICKFIAQFSSENGFAPTIREISRALSISSTSVVQYHILALERAGALTRREGYSRTIRLASGLSGTRLCQSPCPKNALAGAAVHAE